MRIYDESTSRTNRLVVKVNWSRELTFSTRQVNYILDYVPDERGVYCIYAKEDKWRYKPRKLSGLVYIGCGWLNERLSRHLQRQENDILADFLENHELAYRYDRIYDDDEEEDWPRIAEAALLDIFKQKYGDIPLANRREEKVPELNCVFTIEEPYYFSILDT